MVFTAMTTIKRKVIIYKEKEGRMDVWEVVISVLVKKVY